MHERKWDAALARVAPLIVGIEMEGADGRRETLPGVPAPGGIIAVTAQLYSGTEVKDLLTLRRVVQQGQPDLKAHFTANRPEWGLMALQPDRKLSTPLPAYRFSHSLDEHEELGFVDFRDGRPFLLETARIIGTDFAAPDERPWERSGRSLLNVKESAQRGGLVLIDDQGRVVGITEMDRVRFPRVSVALPAEFIDRIGLGQFVSRFVPGAPDSAVVLYRNNPRIVNGDPWAMCAVGQAFELTGEPAEAQRLWAQARQLDPANAWLLAQGRMASGPPS
jgi:hypothetical protein